MIATTRFGSIKTLKNVENLDFFRIANLTYLVHPFLIGVVSALRCSDKLHFDPHSRFGFDENINMLPQRNGRTSLDKLSLQSSTIPDSHWSPIELGILILKLSIELSGIVSLKVKFFGV